MFLVLVFGHSGYQLQRPPCHPQTHAVTHSLKASKISQADPPFLILVVRLTFLCTTSLFRGFFRTKGMMLLLDTSELLLEEMGA